MLYFCSARLDSQHKRKQPISFASTVVVVLSYKLFQFAFFYLLIISKCNLNAGSLTVRSSGDRQQHVVITSFHI